MESEKEYRWVFFTRKWETEFFSDSWGVFFFRKVLTVGCADVLRHSSFLSRKIFRLNALDFLAAAVLRRSSMRWIIFVIDLNRMFAQSKTFPKHAPNWPLPMMLRCRKNRKLPWSRICSHVRVGMFAPPCWMPEILVSWHWRHSVSFEFDSIVTIRISGDATDGKFVIYIAEALDACIEFFSGSLSKKTDENQTTSLLASENYTVTWRRGRKKTGLVGNPPSGERIFEVSLVKFRNEAVNFFCQKQMKVLRCR